MKITNHMKHMGFFKEEDLSNEDKWFFRQEELGEVFPDVYRLE